VTIHVSKGLQYPVVFLPFFYSQREINLNNRLPLYHRKDDAEASGKMKAVIDFVSGDDVVKAEMQKESLAEDMRLAYVAITRAIYQCHIGISASTHNRHGVFHKTIWSHLLGRKEERPEWPVIESALRSRLGEQLFDQCIVQTRVLVREFEPGSGIQGAAGSPQERPKLGEPEEIEVPFSHWQITSYSALAHGKTARAGDKGDDESPDPTGAPEEAEDLLPVEDDAAWAMDPRYTLKGSAVTGSCLHGIFEDYALSGAPAGEFAGICERMLTTYGLDKPAARSFLDAGKTFEALRAEHIKGIQNWLSKAMQQPLQGGLEVLPTLETLIASRLVIPEMAFDFVIGNRHAVPRIDDINNALKAAGLADLELDFAQLHGLMTGSADLVFIHDGKIYVADYKSNTLGKAPRFYDHASMSECMQAKRYDLQYMIYSVAVHRYFSTYLGDRYAFDAEPGKTLSFGGVLYLFLRGMGLHNEGYPGHGVWFTRPQAEHVNMLDMAFKGGLQ
jgi:exodeoxyribonuclease V beta subunit